MYLKCIRIHIVRAVRVETRVFDAFYVNHLLTLSYNMHFKFIHINIVRQVRARKGKIGSV